MTAVVCSFAMGIIKGLKQGKIAEVKHLLKSTLTAELPTDIYKMLNINDDNIIILSSLLSQSHTSNTT